MPRPDRRRILGFQKLENRTLLAGNVIAGPGEQVGELLIEGDLQDNAIAIWKDFNSGRFIVAGAKDSAGNPTLVNGQAAPQSVFGGATQIRLVMKAGNDTVLATGLYTKDFFPRSTGVNILAEMGAQNDKLIIRGDRPATRQLFLNQDQADSIPYGQVWMTGGVSFTGNGGNDKLQFANVAVGGKVEFFGNEGKDIFQVVSTTARNTLLDSTLSSPPSEVMNGNLFSDVFLNMGAGQDQVQISRTKVLHNLVIDDRRASGDTATTSARIDLFNVFILSVSTPQDDKLVIDTRGVASTIAIGGSPLHEGFHEGTLISRAYVLTGDAEDAIALGRSKFTYGISIETDAGDDQVTFNDVTGKYAVGSVYLGAGNDQLITNGSPKADGGDGNDAYLGFGTPAHFESVASPPALNLSGTLDYIRNDLPVALAPAATVTAGSAPDFAGGQLRVRIAVEYGTSNVLAIGGGFTVAPNGDVFQGLTLIGRRTQDGVGLHELVVTFNANATAGAIESLVRSITYFNDGLAKERKIVFTLSDGHGGASAEQTVTVNVT
jgi:hypothetical protein